MSHYMLISSRDPFTCGTTAGYYELARDYRGQGHAVRLFLVGNGVLAARRGALVPELADTVAAGVQVLADSFSLRERAITPGALLGGVSPAPLEDVIDALVNGVKVIWH